MPEWFNDQVAHSQNDQEKSSDSYNKEFMIKRRRKDLMELVATRVNESDSNAKQVADEVISLEQGAWYGNYQTEVRARLCNARTSHQVEFQQYIKINELQLTLVYSLCPESKAAQEMDNATQDSTAFHWDDLLNLYRNLVRVIDTEVTTSCPMVWHRAEKLHVDCVPVNLRCKDTVAVFLPANRSRTAMIENNFEQSVRNTFQIQVEALGEFVLAAGVLSEKVFRQWRDGEWRFDASDVLSTTSPILEMEDGVMFTMRRPAGNSDGPDHLSEGMTKIIECLRLNNWSV